MSEQQGNRLRRVALTGALAPGLLLGAAGAFAFGFIPGGVASTSVSAASVVDGGVCTAFGSGPAAPAGPLSVADVAAKVNPAVVSVINLQKMSAADLQGLSGIEGIPGLPGIDELPGVGELPGTEGIDGSQQIEDDEQSDTPIPVGTGSGFIIDEVGHVVTNAHVVAGAEEIIVTLYDGAEIPAAVVGSDRLLDVALLELELPAGTAVPGIAAFGDSSALRAGDQIVAIGNALGEFPNTVSEGTVNGVDRSFPGEYSLGAMIQHDAEIWHGNSGGPLLNLSGEVVGINTAGIGSGMMGADAGAADMAFAVEGNTVCNAAADLLDDGKIAWPYLGIQGETTPEGQNVLEVVEDGPSAGSGIQAGDVITAFDGQQIDRQHSLLELLFGHEAGDEVTLTVDRGGTPQTFQVTLGERPEITE